METDFLTGTSADPPYVRSDVCSVPAAAVVGEAMVAWVLAAALERRVERHGHRGAANREVAFDPEAIAGLRVCAVDTPAAERDRRMCLGIQEVRRPEVRVAVCDTGVDAGRVDVGLDARAEREACGVDLPDALRELRLSKSMRLEEDSQQHLKGTSLFFFFLMQNMIYELSCSSFCCIV